MSLVDYLLSLVKCSPSLAFYLGQAGTAGQASPHSPVLYRLLQGEYSNTLLSVTSHFPHIPLLLQAEGL